MTAHSSLANLVWYANLLNYIYVRVFSLSFHKNVCGDSCFHSLNLQADIAYVTILERVQIYYSHLRNYEITEGRPNLEKFVEEMNKIEAYKQTKNQPLILLDVAKRHLKANTFSVIKLFPSCFFILYCPLTLTSRCELPDCLRSGDVAIYQG